MNPLIPSALQLLLLECRIKADPVTLMLFTVGVRDEGRGSHLDALEDAAERPLLQLGLREAVRDLLRRAALRALPGAKGRQGHAGVRQHVLGIGCICRLL